MQQLTRVMGGVDTLVNHGIAELRGGASPEHVLREAALMGALVGAGLSADRAIRAVETAEARLVGGVERTEAGYPTGAGGTAYGVSPYALSQWGGGAPTAGLGMMGMGQWAPTAGMAGTAASPWAGAGVGVAGFNPWVGAGMAGTAISPWGAGAGVGMMGTGLGQYGMQMAGVPSAYGMAGLPTQYGMGGLPTTYGMTSGQPSAMVIMPVSGTGY